MENFKFFITVKKDDDEVYTQKLGAEALARMLSGIADTPSNCPSSEHLAQLAA